MCLLLEGIYVCLKTCQTKHYVRTYGPYHPFLCETEITKNLTTKDRKCENVVRQLEMRNLGNKRSHNTHVVLYGDFNQMVI